jgi:hypothetical protein
MGGWCSVPELVVAVVTMRAMLTVAIASQNQTKILKKSVCILSGGMTRCARASIDITNPANGLDPFRTVRLTSQLLAQITHVHVDTPIERTELTFQDCLGQFFTAQHTTHCLEKYLQQIKFQSREFNRLAGPPHLPGVLVQLDLADGYSLGCSQIAVVMSLWVAPSKYGSDPGNQFVWVERLREIIIRADLQTHNPVNVLAPSGQHQNREAGFRANPPQNIKPVQARQHHVQNNQ